MGRPDLVVVGAGVAGLSAALFAARAGLAVALVERTSAGGQVFNVDSIDNFPGVAAGTPGYELGPTLQEQADDAGVEFVLDDVEAIAVDGNDRVVKLGDGELRAAALIIAAGSTKRSLGVPGEERLRGRGVSQCASCDGPLFRGLSAVVVGGGDSALDEAIHLAGHARAVTVVHRGLTFDAQKVLVDRLAGLANVAVRFGSVVDEIGGADVVSTLSVRDLASGAVAELATDGVFVYVGLAPNTAFVHGVVELDLDRRIVVDAMMRTSVDGIFAAGDIRSGSVAMLAASAGDGATAAVAAARYLRALGAGRAVASA